MLPEQPVPPSSPSPATDPVALQGEPSEPCRLRAIERERCCTACERDAAAGQYEQALSGAQSVLEGLGASPDHASLRARAHRVAWQAAKAMGLFELALAHCEAVLTGGQDGAGREFASADRTGESATFRRADAQRQPSGPGPARDGDFVEREIAPLIEQVRLRRKPLALAALELDGLGELSARAGPAAADAALRQLGDLMRQRLRARDVPLRRGATAFVLALADTPPAAATAICERLRAAVEHNDWSRLAPGPRLTVSIGLVASVVGIDAGTELQRADDALRAAQAAGGNRVFPAAPG